MRFIDLLLLIGIGSITGCATTMPKSDNRALLTTTGAKCHEEVVARLQKLTGIGHLRISEDAFTKNATLVLTNHPRPPFPSDDPLVGVIGSEKIVRLLQEDGVCKIALLDENGRIVRSEVLKQCRCRREEEK